MYITGNYLLYHFSYAKIVEYLILVMDTSETFRGLHEACVKPKILTKAVISLPFLPLQPQPLSLHVASLFHSLSTLVVLVQAFLLPGTSFLCPICLILIL